MSANGSNGKAVVLAPKTQFDKLLHRLEQQRVWELAPGYIKGLNEIGVKALELAENDKTPNSIKIQCWRLYKDVASMFMERTVPILQRVTISIPEGTQEEYENEFAEGKQRAVLMLIDSAQRAHQESQGKEEEEAEGEDDEKS